MPTFRVRLHVRPVVGGGRWNVAAAYDRADVEGVHRRAVEYDGHRIRVTQRDGRHDDMTGIERA